MLYFLFDLRDFLTRVYLGGRSRARFINIKGVGLDFSDKKIMKRSSTTNSSSYGFLRKIDEVPY